MRKIIYILSVSLFALSCTKNLDIVVDGGESKLVIEANCPYETQSTVQLRRTLPYNSSDDFETVSNANITITEMESGHVVTLEESKEADYKGFYSTRDFIGTEGGNYQLRVEVDGKVYTALSTRLPVVKIDSIVIKKDDKNPSNPTHLITTYFTDPKEVANYYKANIYINGREYSLISSDRYFNGQPQGLLFRYRGMIDVEAFFSIELQSITEEVHQYYYELLQLSNQMTDISQNPKSNIVGGALGYFSVSSSHWRRIDKND